MELIFADQTGFKVHREQPASAMSVDVHCHPQLKRDLFQESLIESATLLVSTSFPIAFGQRTKSKAFNHLSTRFSGTKVP